MPASARHILLVGLLTLFATSSRGERVDFSRDVRPILSNKCFKCHGPDEETREAGLRLDTAEGATSDRGGYQAITPQDPPRSAVMERIKSTDPDLRMPPADSGLSLSAAEVEVIERWIREGAEYEQHWSLRPIQRPALPVIESSWVRNAIDTFVLAKLRANEMEPSPAADRSTLIRRVHLDLLGLPPTPDELHAFLDDRRPGAYERMVERVLASPHSGERWGRHWLDQARYADTNGYTVDSERSIWPYRDWVIDALNADQPFDQFTIEQLAGDLLPEPTKAQLIATGFHRNTLVNQEGGTDAEQFRNEAVVDRVNTTGAVWLGLTVGCAQCHTHKYDPITHHEYYQLFAFFNSSQDVNTVAPTLELRAGQGKQRPAITTMIMRELKEPRETHVLVRGDFLRKGDRVQPAGPLVLPPIQGHSETDESAANRLDLARWLVSREHPLTARVTVNRVWLHLFGQALVETENDFGLQGTPPTHPELLDWLSMEFMEEDWSLKQLQRLILNSATYRQSSHVPARQVDPLNKLLGRQMRLRVDAEVVRDLGLGVSQLLTNTIGGKSVHPPQPEGVYAFTQRAAAWPTSQGADRYRRGMYTFFMRSAPYPMLTTFDTPRFNTSCTRRVRSNTPLQSLTLANDEAMLEIARALGARLRAHSEDDAARITYAFECCFSRPPRNEELHRLLTFIAEQRSGFTASPTDARSLAGVDQSKGMKEQDAVALAVWTIIARALLNLDEFITRE